MGLRLVGVFVIDVTTEREPAMPRGIDLDLSSGLKTCPKCAIEKPLFEYYRSKATVGGYQVYCKLCCAMHHEEWRKNNMAKCAADQKRHRLAHPERFRDYGRKQRYKLEPGIFAEMLTAQEGKCAICASSDPRGKGVFHVDHCHDEGHVRGLLCHNCNVGIGNFQHSTAALEAAIRYLNRTSQRRPTGIRSA